MIRLLMQWVLSACALLVVSKVVPGFYVEGFGAALTAALVIGFLNATVGLILKLVTFPIGILTLGISMIFINGLMILGASSAVSGFHVRGIGPAFWGAVVLTLLGFVIRAILTDK